MKLLISAQRTVCKW